LPRQDLSDGCPFEFPLKTVKALIQGPFAEPNQIGGGKIDTRNIIQDFISTDLLHGTQEMPLSDDSNLIDAGIIDSLGVMTMLSFLEEQFSIQIANEDLVPENFSSISSIVATIDRYLK
jgi:acyl carrier protein